MAKTDRPSHPSLPVHLTYSTDSPVCVYALTTINKVTEKSAILKLPNQPRNMLGFTSSDFAVFKICLQVVKVYFRYTSSVSPLFASISVIMLISRYQLYRRHD
jgi:hypothetical protein